MLIDVEGERAALDGFLESLASSPPPLAAIDRVRHHPATPSRCTDFSIAQGSVLRDGVHPGIGIHRGYAATSGGQSC